jgi:hypothetical protein
MGAGEPDFVGAPRALGGMPRIASVRGWVFSGRTNKRNLALFLTVLHILGNTR